MLGGVKNEGLWLTLTPEQKKEIKKVLREVFEAGKTLGMKIREHKKAASGPK